MRTFRFFSVSLIFLLFCSTSCGAGSESVSSRRIVVLTPDEIGEIVLPEGAFEREVLVTLPPPTTVSATTTTEENVESEKNNESFIEESSDEVVAINKTSSELENEPVPETTTTNTTTSTSTTTTTEIPKETIPIAEEDGNEGVKLMDSLDSFNSCLSSEGWSFIGLPNASSGPEDPANNPEYLNALMLCNSRTNIATAFEEFQESRNNLTTDEIKEANEQTIRLGECLQKKGWSMGDLVPNADGLLNSTDFTSPDGEVNTADIRSCASELALEGEE